MPVTAAAVFAMAWQTNSTLDLLGTNVGVAPTVKTFYGHGSIALRRAVSGRALTLVAVVTLLGLFSGPWVLQLHGSRHSHRGVHTLLLLLPASVPRTLITLAVADARAHREIWFTVRLPNRTA